MAAALDPNAHRKGIAMQTLNAVQGRIFDARVPWDRIDLVRARADTAVLDLVREACLIESYFATYTARMMDLFWNDVEATSIFSIEAFEAYSHFYLLRRYLETVGYRPVTDGEVIALRAKDRDAAYRDEIRELVNFMMTEQVAARFFDDLAERAWEPVLRDVLGRLGREEVTHARFAEDLLRQRIERDPTVKDHIVRHARDFRHIGAYVLPAVSNAKEETVASILDLDRTIERLTGQRLRPGRALAAVGKEER